MAQDQSPRFRRECYLSRLARRRMPRLLGPLLLLLPKRRLVNQQVRPLRRIHHRGTRPRVARKHHEPPRTVAPHDTFRSDRPTVGQLNRLALRELAPQRTLGNSGGPRLVHVEPPPPLVLLERVPNRSAAVLRGEDVDPIPVAASASPNLQNLPRLYLDDLDFERYSLHSELDRLAKHLLRSLRAIQEHRVRSRLETERTNESDDSE